jgi:hypothetical protein
MVGTSCECVTPYFSINDKYSSGIKTLHDDDRAALANG